MSKTIPQKAIKNLPQGYVILGWGGEFNCPFAFAAITFKGGEWDTTGCEWCRGDEGDLLFAALANSAIVKLNIREFCERIMEDEQPTALFPEDADERKTYPVGTFIRDHFPHAIAALAKHSYEAQQQHGKPTNGACMQWIKDKSVGDGNEIIRHFMEGDYTSTAWRALELLERELIK